MTATHKYLLVAATLFVFLALVSVATIKPDSKPKATRPHLAVVQVTPNGFVPATLTVLRGTVVEWQVADTARTHTIAADPYPKDTSLPSLKSRQLGAGTSYKYTFTTKGRVNYHDDLNPQLGGVINVK